MTAKEYLSELNNYRRIIRSLELQIEEVRHEAEQIRAITYDKDRVQSSPDGDKMAQYLIRLDDLSVKYARNVMLLQSEISKREQMIDALPNKVHAQLLRLVYINGLRLGEAAEEIGKGYRHTTRLHGWALLEFAKKYKNVL